MSLPVIFQTDSYKLSHYKQFPPEADGMYSYLESRGGESEETVFFGLQYLLREYLCGRVISSSNVAEMAHFAKLHGEPFNKEGFDHIVRDHEGRIMVKIQAVKEGSIIPVHNVLMDVESTCPECFWIVTWIETMLMRVWYPITVATNSHRIKQLIRSYLERSSDDVEGQLPFKLHDFGARGVSSHESAMIGGAAHLVNFMGSDTIEGVMMAADHYGDENEDFGDSSFTNYMPGFSLPAAEHSTITAWGREREEDAYRNIIEQFSKPGALYACVSDSYDLWKALDMWGTTLKPLIKEKGGVLVVRPDSGDPPTVVSQTVIKLDHYFGSITNNKGYKVLDGVRVIQGDGINRQVIHKILDTLVVQGYSADNIAFGMGGALLQQVNRDTQRFAYKCSAVHYKDEPTWKHVFKDPVTDPGKRSKSGRLNLMVAREPRVSFWTSNRDEDELLAGIFGPVAGGLLPEKEQLLEPVFENGKLLRHMSFEDVRKQTRAFEPVPVAAE